MTPLEERVRLEQHALSGVDDALGALEESVNAGREAGWAPERVAALVAARDALEVAREGVEGWTGCYTCERVVIPVVEGVADVDCEECEV